MPTWGDIMGEINLVRQQQPGLPPGFACDSVLKKYILQLYQKRQKEERPRAVILYATKWTQPGAGIPPDMLSITDEDLQAFMTVMNGVQETSLDLILHSPGGSLDAAEALVTYLRSKFSDICVIVPQQAMSAATMLACAANTIVLGKHSFLGPTDPQFILPTELGQRVITAQNVEDQFERAQEECADPAKIGAWIPMLKQYGPDLLEKCRKAKDLSKSLVAGWLEQYMFKDQPNARKKAKRVSAWLSNHKNFKSHGRHLNRETLREKGLDKVCDLEADPELQDVVLSIFHATTITFDMTPAVKMVQNHLGKSFVKMMMVPQMMPHTQIIRPPGVAPQPGVVKFPTPSKPAIPPNPANAASGP